MSLRLDLNFGSKFYIMNVFGINCEIIVMKQVGHDYIKIKIIASKKVIFNSGMLNEEPIVLLKNDEHMFNLKKFYGILISDESIILCKISLRAIVENYKAELVFQVAESVEIIRDKLLDKIIAEKGEYKYPARDFLSVKHTRSSYYKMHGA